MKPESRLRLRLHRRAGDFELRTTLLAEADGVTILEPALRVAHQPSWAISVSALSNQYGITISRYIVVALMRCSCACSRWPVRR